MAGTTPPLSALLIGIDHYPPSASRTQVGYGNLGGCVRDVERVNAYLTDEVGVPAQRIRRLTASVEGGEAPGDSPTAPNIVAAWRELCAAAATGEQVWIHYSGHGGRVPTCCPEVKGEDGLDEVIVPTDVGDPQAAYLRDTEIAVLLREMIDAGLLVTLVLDSCHSGGCARGDATRRPRGTGQVDPTSRPTPALVATPAELARNWRELSPRRARDVEVASGWLPAPRGYVLFAACRAQEQAFEDTWSGGEEGGALTNWFLDTARRWPPGYTWEELHSRVRSRVIGELGNQTPQLEGDRERIVFGSEERSMVALVDVLRVDGERLLLNTGQAQGVRRGARFAVYPPGGADLLAADVRDRAGRLAIVEIRDPGSTASWAEVVERVTEEAIEVGARTVLIGAASGSACKVFLPEGSGDPVRLALEEDGSGFVVTVAEVAEADFAVAASGGEWVIRTTDGAPIAGQDPRPGMAEDHAIVAGRLVHLAKYCNIRQIANHNPFSPLRGKLRLALHRLGEDHDPSQSPKLLPLDLVGDVAEVPLGERLCLELTNRSKQVLNVALLNLRPSWGIAKIYPPKALGAFLPFDPGQRELLPLRAGLPEGMAAGSDVLKVFATVDAAPFEWLELPPLERAHRGMRSPPRVPANALETLFASLAFTGPRRRSIELEGAAGYDWTTEEVEIRVVRR